MIDLTKAVSENTSRTIRNETNIGSLLLATGEIKNLIRDMSKDLGDKIDRRDSVFLARSEEQDKRITELEIWKAGRENTQIKLDALEFRISELEKSQSNREAVTRSWKYVVGLIGFSNIMTILTILIK